MNLKEERYRLTIEPKTEVEVAYVEEVLGLRRDGDHCKLVRKNAMGLSCIAYLETKVVDNSPKAEIWKPRTLAEHICGHSGDRFSDMSASFIKRMYNRASYVNDDYQTEKELKKQMTKARLAGNYTEVAIIAMLLSEVHADDKEA